jgi:hypothetical protein
MLACIKREVILGHLKKLYQKIQSSDFAKSPHHSRIDTANFQAPVTMKYFLKDKAKLATVLLWYCKLF